MLHGLRGQIQLTLDLLMGQPFFPAQGEYPHSLRGQVLNGFVDHPLVFTAELCLIRVLYLQPG